MMKGSCLCRSVSFSTDEKINEITACHCEMCNKWASSAFISVQPKENFHTFGKENIASYQSSDWAERTFCKKCGTHLYCKSKNPESYHFNAALFSLFDEINSISLEIFSDKKPHYYPYFNESSLKMDEKDVLEFISGGKNK